MQNLKPHGRVGSRRWISHLGAVEMKTRTSSQRQCPRQRRRKWPMRKLPLTRKSPHVTGRGHIVRSSSNVDVFVSHFPFPAFLNLFLSAFKTKTAKTTKNYDTMRGVQTAVHNKSKQAGPSGKPIGDRPVQGNMPVVTIQNVLASHCTNSGHLVSLLPQWRTRWKNVRGNKWKTGDQGHATLYTACMGLVQTWNS